jgi:hypothetical protein
MTGVAEAPVLIKYQPSQGDKKGIKGYVRNTQMISAPLERGGVMNGSNLTEDRETWIHYWKHHQ